MADPTEILNTLFAVTERAKESTEQLKAMAEQVPGTETAVQLLDARQIMVIQNKLLRITIEALMKFEDQRQELARLFEEHL